MSKLRLRAHNNRKRVMITCYSLNLLSSLFIIQLTWIVKDTLKLKLLLGVGISNGNGRHKCHLAFGKRSNIHKSRHHTWPHIHYCIHLFDSHLHAMVSHIGQQHSPTSFRCLHVVRNNQVSEIIFTYIAFM